MFTVTVYRGRLAVFDTKAHVYYMGYSNRAEAEKHCAELNELCSA